MSGTRAPARVRIEESIDDLLAGAEARESWKAFDSLSGSRFERITIGGARYVVKYVSVDDDWIMRATGDLHCRQLTMLESHVLDALPRSIDHAIIGCAPYAAERNRRGMALLMRDVSASLVPAGGEPIALELHREFIERMAHLHAAYWGFRDQAGLIPLAHHYVFLTPTMAELETATPRADPVPPAVRDGWLRLSQAHPTEARRLLALAADPWPLVAALQAGPQTLIHGDWKLGNLGREGSRTILLDWDRTGEGPPLVDLAWYLAVNCDRIPAGKEDTIAAYRTDLESAGIATASWWDAQLAAALAGAFLQLCWSKTDDPDEFAWWGRQLARWDR